MSFHDALGVRMFGNMHNIIEGGECNDETLTVLLLCPDRMPDASSTRYVCGMSVSSTVAPEVSFDCTCEAFCGED